MRLLKCCVLGAALSLGAVAAYSGPFEDGMEAYLLGDHSAAAKFVRKAADNGSADAQCCGALMMLVGALIVLVSL